MSFLEGQGKYKSLRKRNLTPYQKTISLISWLDRNLDPYETAKKPRGLMLGIAGKFYWDQKLQNELHNTQDLLQNPDLWVRGREKYTFKKARKENRRGRREMIDWGREVSNMNNTMDFVATRTQGDPRQAYFNRNPTAKIAYDKRRQNKRAPYDKHQLDIRRKIRKQNKEQEARKKKEHEERMTNDAEYRRTFERNAREEREREEEKRREFLEWTGRRNDRRTARTRERIERERTPHMEDMEEEQEIELRRRNRRDMDQMEQEIPQEDSFQPVEPEASIPPPVSMPILPPHFPLPPDEALQNVLNTNQLQQQRMQEAIQRRQETAAERQRRYDQMVMEAQIVNEPVSNVRPPVRATHTFAPEPTTIEQRPEITIANQKEVPYNTEMPNEDTTLSTPVRDQNDLYFAIPKILREDRYNQIYKTTYLKLPYDTDAGRALAIELYNAVKKGVIPIGRFLRSIKELGDEDTIDKATESKYLVSGIYKFLTQGKYTGDTIPGYFQPLYKWIENYIEQKGLKVSKPNRTSSVIFENTENEPRSKQPLTRQHQTKKKYENEYQFVPPPPEGTKNYATMKTWTRALENKARYYKTKTHGVSSVVNGKAEEFAREALKILTKEFLNHGGVGKDFNKAEELIAPLVQYIPEFKNMSDADYGRFVLNQLPE